MPFDTVLVTRAETIARIAHTVQQYEGQSYADGHLAQVVKRARSGSTVVTAAAWLHDVLEDTLMTAPDLFALLDKGSPDVQDVVDIVVQLTRTPGDPYEEYIQRIADHACNDWREPALVKEADLLTNIANATGEHERHLARWLVALAEIERALYGVR